jgi:O-antigen ligase
MPLLLALVVLGVPLLLLVNMKFGGIFTDRVIEMLQDPVTRSGDRTTVWLQGINRMMNHPLTLLTGFGWDAYSVMGIFYVTHNYYLLLWFELGVIGVVSYCVIIRRAALTARAAAEIAPAELRAYLVAFIFGMCCVSVAVFFSLLYKPWLYIWAYIGITMRLAVIVFANAKNATRPESVRATPAVIAVRRYHRPKRSRQLRAGR